MDYLIAPILEESGDSSTTSSTTRMRANTCGTTSKVRRRRHSSYHPSSWSNEAENIQLLIDGFLLRLSNRLDMAEIYSTDQLDAGFDRAYTTLLAVRDSCSRVVGDSARRARIFVETLEETCKDVLTTKETMEQKVSAGIKMLEEFLIQVEQTHCEIVVDASQSSLAIQENIDQAWRKVDSGVHAAIETIDGGIEKARRAKEQLQESIELAVERALTRAREQGLLMYSELPDPWKGNPHILSGYRFCSTASDCIRSTLYLNNELFNIWSHLVGIVIVLSLAFYFFPSTPTFSLSTTPDLIVAGLFFVAAGKCLVCSTLWHTFNSIAHQSSMERLACVDYTGISMLVAASIVTTEYTAFYCHPGWQAVYMSVTAILGVCGTIMAWHPVFNKPELAWLRVCFFSGIAATGCIPLFHLAMDRGMMWTVNFYMPIIQSLSVYLAGAVLYAMKIPECWWPGGFDYLGASHNIWHVAVLGGIVFHYRAMLQFFDQAYAYAGVACPAIA